MPASDYIAGIRARIGHDLLMVVSVAAVVVDSDGRLLLGRRADTGEWSLIAGCVDPGEQPATALVREVYEETGVDVEIERLVGVALHPSVYPHGDVCEFMNLWFRCRPVGGVAQVNDEESLEVGWFPPDALPELSEWSLIRIEKALQPASTPTWFAPAGVHVPELGFPVPPSDSVRSDSVRSDSVRSDSVRSDSARADAARAAR
jgi:8-oxo-dGTP diphosphatase